MEMLKILTQKLRQQSLNEVQPFQSKEIEDIDSGTESDDENRDLEALEGDDAMQENVDRKHNRGQYYSRAQDLGTFCFRAGVGSRHTPSPQRSSSSPVNSVTRRPFQLVNHPDSPFRVLDELGELKEANSSNSKKYGKTANYTARCDTDSSDFERCSLDYEPTSSAEFDRHSSEEELTVINLTPQELQPEKRKWSQIQGRCGSCQECSGSSDEEVRDLLSSPTSGNDRSTPVTFSSSPPQGVLRLSRTMSSPQHFIARVSPAPHICVMSPRKRHRHNLTADVTKGVADSDVQRPYLDLEKMQKTPFRKHVSHGISKARIVKIRSFNGSNRPPKCLYDPSVFAFRSISMGFSPLTPVEEPSFAY